MPMGRRVFVLDVEEQYADDLLVALSKRSYLKVIHLEESETCPACKRSMPKPHITKIDPELVEVLVMMAGVMKIARSVLLVHGKGWEDEVSVHESPRCVEVSKKTTQFLNDFGFVEECQDGKNKAYRISKKGLAFLMESEISPSRLFYLNDALVEVDPRVTSLRDLKIKDRVAHAQLIDRVREAVRNIPEGVKKLISSGGQSPLII